MDNRRRPDLLIRQVQNGWVVAERDVVDGCSPERGGREHVATSADALAALVLDLTGGANVPPEVSGVRIMPCGGAAISKGDALARFDGRASALFGGATPVADAAG